MSPDDSTLPVDVERRTRRNGREDAPSQTGDVWSFSSRPRIFAPSSPPPPTGSETERSAAPNTSDSPTVTPRRPADLSALRPIAPHRPAFGKRGFTALYQWEGVVEEVNGGGFRARLLPFEDGQADSSRVEYADFAYDDLGDESDHELVAEGAIFYWTVGKSRNAAGTYTNTSLVRFRRLPPSTPYQMREAAREADALLADLDAD